MKLLITGGAGFLGSLLARRLLARRQLGGRTIEQLVLADQVPISAKLASDPRVEGRCAPLSALAPTLAREPFDGIFHLASAVSAECERDFDLGLSANLDSTRALLDALRAAGNGPRIVFSSSVAVFGSDPAIPLPAVIQDDTLPMPQSSYGIQKFICEQLIADYTRKGFIDGRSVRLMTVSVRPGRPNGAASSFLSGIIREPLAGQAAVCPVSPQTEVALASPANTIEGLITVYEADRARFGGRTALNLPALTVRIQDMLDALEHATDPRTRALVRFEPDASIAHIVGAWPARFASQRAQQLGLKPDRHFADIIEQYRLMVKDTSE